MTLDRFQKPLLFIVSFLLLGVSLVGALSRTDTTRLPISQEVEPSLQVTVTSFSYSPERVASFGLLMRFENAYPPPLKLTDAKVSVEGGGVTIYKTSLNPITVQRESGYYDLPLNVTVVDSDDRLYYALRGGALPLSVTVCGLDSIATPPEPIVLKASTTAGFHHFGRNPLPRPAWSGPLQPDIPAWRTDIMQLKGTLVRQYLEVETSDEWFRGEALALTVQEEGSLATYFLLDRLFEPITGGYSHMGDEVYAQGNSLKYQGASSLLFLSDPWLSTEAEPDFLTKADRHLASLYGAYQTDTRFGSPRFSRTKSTFMVTYLWCPTMGAEMIENEVTLTFDWKGILLDSSGLPSPAEMKPASVNREQARSAAVAAGLPTEGGVRLRFLYYQGSEHLPAGYYWFVSSTQPFAYQTNLLWEVYVNPWTGEATEPTRAVVTAY